MRLSKFLADEYFGTRAPADATRHQHEVVVRHLRRWLGKEPTTDIFNRHTFPMFVKWLQQGREPSTVNLYRSIVLQWWEFAYASEIVTNPPVTPQMVPPLKVNRRNPMAWSVDELERIMHAAEKVRFRGWSEWDWKALVLVLYDTGARIEQVRWCRRCDLKGDRLYLNPIYDKKRKERNPRLAEQTIYAIQKMLGLRLYDPYDWLFRRRPETQQLRRFLHKILNDAGMDSSRYSKLHRFRKTAVTLAAANSNIDTASNAIGHANRDVTLKYLDMTKLPAMDPVDFLPRLKMGPEIQVCDEGGGI